MHQATPAGLPGKEEEEAEDDRVDEEEEEEEEEEAASAEDEEEELEDCSALTAFPENERQGKCADMPASAPAGVLSFLGPEQGPTV